MAPTSDPEKTAINPASIARLPLEAWSTIARFHIASMLQASPFPVKSQESHLTYLQVRQATHLTANADRLLPVFRYFVAPRQIRVFPTIDVTVTCFLIQITLEAVENGVNLNVAGFLQQIRGRSRSIARPAHQRSMGLVFREIAFFRPHRQQQQSQNSATCA